MKTKILIIFLSFLPVILFSQPRLIKAVPIETQVSKPVKDPIKSIQHNNIHKPLKNSKKENSSNTPEKTMEHKRYRSYNYICEKCGCHRGSKFAMFECNSTCKHLWRKQTEGNLSKY